MKKSRILTSLASVSLCASALGGVSAFADTVAPNPSSSSTSLNTTLTLPTVNPDEITPPKDPQNPDQSGDDKTDISGDFGIAYIPKTLSGTDTLATTGSQKISLAAGNNISKYNVGVQDTLRQKHQWNLTAQLSWNGNNASYMSGATITGTNGTVQLNNKGVLSALTHNEVTTDAQTLTISKTPTSVLKSDGTETTNGLYNYGFENPELSIPDVTVVPGGSYSGTITWNLSTTPTGPQP